MLKVPVSAAILAVIFVVLSAPVLSVQNPAKQDGYCFIGLTYPIKNYV